MGTDTCTHMQKGLVGFIVLLSKQLIFPLLFPSLRSFPAQVQEMTDTITEKHIYPQTACQKWGNHLDLRAINNVSVRSQ